MKYISYTLSIYRDTNGQWIEGKMGKAESASSLLSWPSNHFLVFFLRDIPINRGSSVHFFLRSPISSTYIHSPSFHIAMNIYSRWKSIVDWLKKKKKLILILIEIISRKRNNNHRKSNNNKNWWKKKREGFLQVILNMEASHVKKKIITQVCVHQFYFLAC